MSKEPHIDILDESHILTVEELCERCQVEITWIEELVARGGFSPIEDGRQFAEVTIRTVRTAQRL
jgi:hypothetical protein